MLLAPDETQIELLTAVGDMLAGEAPFDRWYVPDLDVVAEEARLMDLAGPMGWLGMAAPVAVGGSGGDLVDECLVFMKLGERIMPLGLLAGAVAVSATIAAGQSDLAAAFIAGTARAALAAGEEPRAFGTAGATHVLRIAQTELSLAQGRTIGAETVALDASSSTATIAEEESLLRSIDAPLKLRLQLLAAAMLQGLARTACNESNAYAKVREQFGRPIGSFQAVRHRIADMELRARLAEAQVSFAAVALRDGRADAELQVLSALLLAGDAAMSNGETNIHNHGAIGTTTENIGHLLLKRAILLIALTGEASLLKDRIADCQPPII